MKVTQHPIGLETLDTLAEVDTLCLFIGEDERPLRGVAGFLDWRMCGELSRLLATNFFTGTLGDSLLLPTHGRVRAHRVFALGTGPRGQLDASRLGELLGKTAEILSKAKVETVALEVPGAPQVDEAARAATLEQIFLARFSGNWVVMLQEKTPPTPASSPLSASERRSSR